jgi:hypothetical protein
MSRFFEPCNSKPPIKSMALSLFPMGWLWNRLEAIPVTRLKATEKLRLETQLSIVGAFMQKVGLVSKVKSAAK